MCPFKQSGKCINPDKRCEMIRKQKGDKRC